tara:strand:- start:3042 stop:3257 length:216 start_codon:yes stop_codon:yes gene_type:complete
MDSVYVEKKVKKNETEELNFLENKKKNQNIKNNKNVDLQKKSNIDENKILNPIKYPSHYGVKRRNAISILE